MARSPGFKLGNRSKCQVTLLFFVGNKYELLVPVKDMKDREGPDNIQTLISLECGRFLEGLHAWKCRLCNYVALIPAQHYFGAFVVHNNLTQGFNSECWPEPFHCIATRWGGRLTVWKNLCLPLCGEVQDPCPGPGEQGRDPTGVGLVLPKV